MVWFPEQTVTLTGSAPTTVYSKYTNTSNSLSVTWDKWVRTTTTTGSSETWRMWNDSGITNSTNVTTVWNSWGHADDRSFVQPSRPRATPTPRIEANKRADKLLVEHLTEEQERSLAAHGHFDVVALVDGVKRMFRIHNNRYQHNVFEIDESGRELREYCAHTSHACPQSDHALAQKILLERAPEEFLRVANVWDLQNGRSLL